MSEAIGALRDELTRAWWDGQNRTVRFKPSPVELTLQVAVTSAGSGKAGVSWWVLEFSGELSRASAVTQTIKVSLDPVIFDDAGHPLEFLVDVAEDQPHTGGVEVALDAPD